MITYDIGHLFLGESSHVEVLNAKRESFKSKGNTEEAAVRLRDIFDANVSLYAAWPILSSGSSLRGMLKSGLSRGRLVHICFQRN